jgi:hypothetical protein
MLARAATKHFKLSKQRNETVEEAEGARAHVQ